jgi:hypothetical protein
MTIPLRHSTINVSALKAGFRVSNNFMVWSCLYYVACREVNTIVGPKDYLHAAALELLSTHRTVFKDATSEFLPTSLSDMFCKAQLTTQGQTRTSTPARTMK